MPKYSEKYILEILRVYQPMSEEKLTRADAEEIAETTIGLFTLLNEIYTKAVNEGTIIPSKTRLNSKREKNTDTNSKEPNDYSI